ncbi:MAG: aspartate 1-decarboxylase [Candidatus Krumholzibacteria bacterium]|nr:aspartate 1-decarboxylase [Candidatus Krumholzibacteria bacterium]
MKRLFLKSMILKATVTLADLRYVGSITIDEDLIERAGLSEHENVHVVDRTNGNRLQTYVIVGERGSGVIGINGAAAHLVSEGDVVDIMAFGWSAGAPCPLIVEVDGRNRFERFAGEV